MILVGKKEKTLKADRAKMFMVIVIKKFWRILVIMSVDVNVLMSRSERMIFQILVQQALLECRDATVLIILVFSKSK